MWLKEECPNFIQSIVEFIDKSFEEKKQLFEDFSQMYMSKKNKEKIEEI